MEAYKVGISRCLLGNHPDELFLFGLLLDNLQKKIQLSCTKEEKVSDPSETLQSMIVEV